MTKEETLINLGNEAEQLVNSEVFNKTINRMVEGSFQAFVNSKPEDIYSSINFLLKISTSIALGGRSSSTPSGKLQRIFELIY